MDQPERLAEWWGPKGFSTQVVKFDLRPGGIFHYFMKAADGQDMWARFIYREIEPQEKIVFVNSFSNEAGEITRASFSPVWPLEVLFTMTLEERDGKTLLTLRGEPINATAEERKRFEAEFPSMEQGFGETWDQLDAYLRSNAL